jgi:hypothetical protein
MKTGAGNTWEEHRVRATRNHVRLPAHDPSSSAGTTLTTEQAAKRLGIATRTVRRLVEEKIVPATQVVATDPWVIAEASLSSAGVREEVRRIRSGRKAPRALLSENQGSMFSMMWPGGAE